MRKSLQEFSVLIVLPGSLGDVVLASPVAKAIKLRNPNARICWLIDSKNKEALNGHPAIDEIICWDKQAWASQIKRYNLPGLINSMRVIRRVLKPHKFELALDLQGNTTSGLLTWLSNAKTRIGLGSREGNTLFMTRTVSLNHGDHAQIGAEYRYLMSQLGYPDVDWTMHVPLSQPTAEELHPPIPETEHYAVICPLTAQTQSHWQSEYWQQLILRIRGRYQLRTLILGNEKNNQQAEDISRLCGALNLAGKTSFQQACALIKGASLVIGVDNEYTHVGHALKIPTISLFGSTCPYSHTGQETSTIIYLDKECSPCYNKPSCKGKYQCINDISPDHVLTEIKPLMKNFFEPIKIKAS